MFIQKERYDMDNEKEKFTIYESIRKSGITNMFDVRMVCELSGGVLNRDDCLYIMRNYQELEDKYHLRFPVKKQYE